MPGCNHCDEIAGRKTFDNQIHIPIKGRVCLIDYCIHKIVAALNASNITTVASCCGHNTGPGIINLQDGRVLLVVKDEETANQAHDFLKHVYKFNQCDNP